VAHQARKRFGQHFLVDSGVIHAIVRTIEPNPQDAVIEIGPGLGAMTRPLLISLNEMSVVELDRDLVKRWRSESHKNLIIHEADALKFDFLNWAKNACEKIQETNSQAKVKIVGNLPYNISSPLLFHLMGAVDYVDEQVFMLQAEVIERMVAQHGDSEYSRLSVMLQSRYHLENVLDVAPEAFDPPPKVNSAVVKMIPRIDLKLSASEYKSLASLVSMAFAQRRKVLRNNLSAVKERLNLSDEILTLRAQDISVEDYITWACKLAHQ
jgi:16S rRNA (adenine1518-N6/adenine1519-N6)-dimethyltransferase